MLGLVVGTNREAVTSISQTLAADGCHVAVHQPVHWPDTVAHLRHAAGDVVIYVCPHARCCGDCLLRQLRADGNRRPVIAIAARGSADTWTGCHTAGADDYLAAPPQDPVLLAHVRALTRRSSSQFAVHSNQLKVGDLELDPVTRTVRRGGQPIKLTRGEFALLKHLMEHAGQPCPRRVLYEQVLGGRGKPGSKVLEMRIARLRAKVDGASSPRLIHTIRTVGYMLKAE